MKIKVIINLIFIVFFSSFTVYAQENEIIKNRINELKNENYVGDGLANIDDDLHEARQLSKERAIASLAESIEVNVRSEVERIIVERTDEYGEQFEEEFKQVIQTYTDIAISNRQDDWHIDYPVQNYVTTIVWISKEEYALRVSEDITNKINYVTGLIKNGAREFGRGDYMIGITHWIDAKSFLEDAFGRLPVEVQLTEKTDVEEANSYLNRRILNFFGNIHLFSDREEYFYDSEGKLRQTPEVYAQYMEGTTKRPIINLPLRVDFVRGSGRVDGQMRTGLHGQTRIGIDNIDPSYPETIFNVTIDNIDGLELFPMQPPPSSTVNLKRLRSAVLSVNFTEIKGNLDIKGLWGSVSTIIGGGGFSVVEYTIRGRTPTDRDMERARQAYADYLVAASFWIDNSGPMPNFENMYYVYYSGVLGLYDVTSGSLLHEISLSQRRGLGTTLDLASRHAYNKIRDELIKEARNLPPKMK